MDEIARNDAIIFLAHVTSKKQKDETRRILSNWESSSNKERLGVHLLGIAIRNALRAGGFPWGSLTLDTIWLDLYAEAVDLPEERMVLSKSVEEAVERFRDGNLV
jgi:hypothetical protein